MTSLDPLLEDTLLLLLNTTAVEIKPHHYGKGIHILVQFSNGQQASITKDTCHTDSNNTYELMATEYMPKLSVEDTLCHASLEVLLESLTYLNSL